MLSYITRYFTLNRRERNAILAMISLLFALIVVKYVVVHASPANTLHVAVVELDSIAAKLSVADLLSPAPKENGKHGFASRTGKDSLFYFDPNVISVEQAMQLGFEKKCALQLVHYREKGGKFYKPADVEKLYCMDKELFSRIEKYIIIGGAKFEKKENSEAEAPNTGVPRYTMQKENKKSISIEINSADSIQWMSLRGIGPGYTRRILKYKSILGGFTSVEQIKEVYNFPDSVYQSIKGNLTVNPGTVQKLKVNTVDFKTLVHHPYIKYEGTKCIFALKRGKNIKEEDLKGSSCFSREQLEKLLPYLDFSE